MPASGVSPQPRTAPDDTPRGLATRVYSPYGAGRLGHGCRRPCYAKHRASCPRCSSSSTPDREITPTNARDPNISRRGTRVHRTHEACGRAVGPDDSAVMGEDLEPLTFRRASEAEQLLDTTSGKDESWLSTTSWTKISALDPPLPAVRTAYPTFVNGGDADDAGQT